MTDAVNANAVGDAIRVVAQELRPWMEKRIEVWPPDRRGETSPFDPQYLGWVLREQWLASFSRDFGLDGHVVVAGFRHVRNQWAHHVPFEDADAVRAIEVCRRLLSAIRSPRVGEMAGLVQLVLGTFSAAAVSQPRVEAKPRAASHRGMRSPAFREEQWSHRFDPHVAPLNELVDSLIEARDGSWMPYIPPYHGGIEAEIVLLYQDPGKMTSTDHGGSGFLGCENDDPSAQLLAECLDAAGVRPRRVTPWNAYPWFLPEQGGVSDRMVREGVDPLRQLLGLTGEAHTLVTGGSKAHLSWRRFVEKYPAEAGRWRHIPTFHTSGRGITNGGQQTKAEGVAHVVAALRQALQCPNDA